MFTTTDTILAIDLGRYKSVACVFASESELGFDRLQDGRSDRLGIFVLIHVGWP